MPGLAPGARVRVEMPELLARRATGTVMAVAGDSVRVAIPMSGVSFDHSDAVRYYWLDPRRARMEVSSGRSRGRSIRRGAMVGVATGAFTTLTFLAVGATDGRTNDEDGLLLIFAPVYVASTGIIGAALGSLFTIERWTRVP